MLSQRLFKLRRAGKQTPLAIPDSPFKSCLASTYSTTKRCLDQALVQSPPLFAPNQAETKS
jgi:hypothetical protein